MSAGSEIYYIDQRETLASYLASILTGAMGGIRQLLQERHQATSNLPSVCKGSNELTQERRWVRKEVRGEERTEWGLRNIYNSRCPLRSTCHSLVKHP